MLSQETPDRPLALTLEEPERAREKTLVQASSMGTNVSACVRVRLVASHFPPLDGGRNVRVTVFEPGQPTMSVSPGLLLNHVHSRRDRSH